MRIQHNISALNAYNKLNGNNNRLAKNLEKLSSGYSINRAADNAAGLAISEKMRAQITGLETAQQNSKDGISLVQTAEGALTEVHSMLNRMVALTTQASNGIYEDSERTKIQDELDQLCEEIDRIADATNFNGIKLLDGSMTSKDSVATTEKTGAQMGIPAEGPTQQTNTITHVKGNPKTEKTKMGIDLGDYRIQNAGDGDKITVTLGDPANGGLTIDLEVDDAQAATDTTGQYITAEEAGDTAKLAAAIKDRLDGITAAAGGTAGTIAIGGQDFNYTVDATKENEITFEQAAEPADASEVVAADMEVKAEFTSGGAGGTAGTALTVDNQPANTTVTAAGGTTTSKGSLTLDVTGMSISAPTAGANGAKVSLSLGTVGGNALSVDIDVTGAMTDAQIADALVGTTVTVKDGTGTNDIVLTAVKTTGNTIKWEAANDGATNIGANTTANATVANQGVVGGGGTEAGHINQKTTVQQQGGVPTPGVYANTNFTVTTDNFADGSKLKIGDETYVFSADGKATVDASKGEVLVDMTGVDLTDLDACGAKLTEAAKNNATFTVSYKDDKVELMETKANSDLFDAGDAKGKDLTSKEKIEAQLGASSSTTTAATGNALRLQIGDTDDTFNMLDVDVQDCHAAAIGVGLDVMRVDDVDVANKAMMAAKAAIENVSAVRSKMGAIQNRLDHTLNNLEETTTNLTEAESRIRDTDMAKEMMQYTKNNILIQSSQAMLAQANQVPQGVLQLLQ